MNEEALVRDHYSGDDLEEVVLDALRASSADVDALTVEDLAGLDQLHAGSVAATEYLLGCLDLSPGVVVLDAGCGVGGPARLGAARYGCRVTGIDLSPDFVALARFLTKRLNLGSLVSFQVGSATELPFDEAMFDRAMLNHAGMNIADKARLFGEVRRTMKEGGLFGLHEQMRTDDGVLTYPLPWADDEASSFVEPRERYVELLTHAGFQVDLDEDRTAANTAAGPPLGALSPGVLFGPAWAERIGNSVAATMAGTISSIVMVARAV